MQKATVSKMVAFTVSVNKLASFRSRHTHHRSQIQEPHMKQIALFAMAATCAVAAHANPAAAGKLTQVEGTVSISGAKGVARAASGTPVQDGASILVSSDGKASLVLNNGCVVLLNGSQHLKVDAKMACDEVQAAVKQLFPAYKVAQAGIGAGTTSTTGTGTAVGAGAGVGATAVGVSTAAIVAGVVIGAAVINEAVKNDTPVSGQ